MKAFCQRATTGSRRKHPCKIISLFFCDLIRKKMNDGKLAVVVYVDLSKAFDTIRHNVLMNKLSAYGITDKELE